MSAFRLDSVPRLALASVLAAGLVVWLAHGAALLGFPFQFDYGEGGTMIASWRLAQGLSVYPDIQEAPYFVNPYTPVYLWLGSLFMGDGPTLFGGRLLSLGSGLGVACLLFVWLRREGGLAAALVGTTVFVVHPLVLGWTVLYRTDSLALFFGFAGLLVAEAALRQEDPPPGRLVLAALLLALGVYTKQSMVAPVLAVLGAAWLAGFRPGVRLTGLVLLMLACPALALEAFSQGRFLGTVFGYNVMPFQPEQARLYLGGYLCSAPGMVFLAALCAVRDGFRRHRLGWLFLAASLPIALGSGRQGGFYNYCLELHLALAVLSGLAWQPAAQGRRGWAWAVAVLLTLQVALGGASRLPPYLLSPWDHLRFETGFVLRGEAPPWRKASLDAGGIASWLERNPGPILAENLANPTLLGRTPWVVDPMILFTLARNGRWNPEPVLERVDRQEFAVIFLQVLEGNIRFSPQAIARIQARYRVVGRAGVDLVLLPRPRAGP